MVAFLFVSGIIRFKKDRSRRTIEKQGVVVSIARNEDEDHFGFSLSNYEGIIDGSGNKFPGLSGCSKGHTVFVRCRVPIYGNKLVARLLEFTDLERELGLTHSKIQRLEYDISSTRRLAGYCQEKENSQPTSPAKNPLTAIVK